VKFLQVPQSPQVHQLSVVVAAVITFVVIIVVMFESVVVIEAGQRGVVLYVGEVENRVLGEGNTLYHSICRIGSATGGAYSQVCS
jgi:hypothetical protein